MMTCLRGRIPSAGTYKNLSVLQAEFLQDCRESSPSDIGHGFSKAEGLFHCCNIEVFNRNHVVSSDKSYSNLMKKIFPAMLGFRMQPGDFLALFVVIVRIFNHVRTSALLFCNTFLKLPILLNEFYFSSA